MRDALERRLRQKAGELSRATKDRLRDRASLRTLLLALLVVAPIIYFTEFAVFASLVAASAVVAYLISIFDFRWSGIETTTFTVILAGMVFGPVNGAIAGFVLVLLQMIVGQQMGVYVLWVVPSYAVAGAVAGILGPSAVVMTGIGITVALHVAFTIFTSIFTPGAVARYLPYAAGNVLVNILLFEFAAGPVLALLG